MTYTYLYIYMYIYTHTYIIIGKFGIQFIVRDILRNLCDDSIINFVKSNSSPTSQILLKMTDTQ